MQLLLAMAMTIVSVLSPPQRMSFVPETPVQGQPVSIGYDFHNSGVTSTTIRVHFTPGTEYTDYVLTEENPEVIVPVPANATSVLLEDGDGPSPDKSSAVDIP